MNGIFGEFDFVCQLCDFERKSFLNIMERLLLNMEIRFPCPSSSIDRRQTRQTFNRTTNNVDQRFLQSVKTNCPLFLTVGIYLFPDDFIRHRKINQFFLSGNFPEIIMITTDIVNNQEAILERARRNNIGPGRDNEFATITLLDVFQVVNPENYPFLWDITMNAVTIFPTTVSCEQQFSRLRNRLHENMEKETSFQFMMMSQKRTVFEFCKGQSSQTREWQENGSAPTGDKRVELVRQIKMRESRQPEHPPAETAETSHIHPAERLHPAVRLPPAERPHPAAADHHQRRSWKPRRRRPWLPTARISPCPINWLSSSFRFLLTRVSVLKGKTVEAGNENGRKLAWSN